MEERGNKTIMCSVLFLDIVEYSRKPVSAQIAQKELFNAMLANAIQHVPVGDRVILDTGDGAALTFLGDVEDALKTVLAFRASLLSEGATMDPPLQVCMGINLGPVRLVKDINGQPNIVGDGINVAQRIMGFAKPGQILVSRSYHDAASRLSQDYAGMFYSEGMRADKHDREHETYAILQPGEAAAMQEVAAKQASTGALAAFRNASGQQRALYAGIAASVLALLIVIAVKITHRPQAPAPKVAVQEQTAPAAPKIAESMAAKKTDAARPADVSGGQVKDSKRLPGSRTHQGTAAKKAPETKSGAMASVHIVIAPWGEVYLDGKKQGVSPPLDVLHVTPGSHAIEIRNTTFSPYTLSIQVKAGEQMKIKHKFAN